VTVIRNQREDRVVEADRILRHQRLDEEREAMIEPRQVGRLVRHPALVARLVDRRQIDGEDVRAAGGVRLSLEVRIRGLLFARQLVHQIGVVEVGRWIRIGTLSRRAEGMRHETQRQFRLDERCRVDRLGFVGVVAGTDVLE